MNDSALMTLSISSRIARLILSLYGVQQGKTSTTNIFKQIHIWTAQITHWDSQNFLLLLSLHSRESCTWFHLIHTLSLQKLLFAYANVTPSVQTTNHISKVSVLSFGRNSPTRSCLHFLMNSPMWQAAQDLIDWLCLPSWEWNFNHPYFSEITDYAKPKKSRFKDIRKARNRARKIEAKKVRNSRT